MFNCVALSITLFAMVLARKGPTFAYTYGYDRHEVVAAFSNSMFLLFVRHCMTAWLDAMALTRCPCPCCVTFANQVSCFLALESLHRVVNPVIIDATRLIEVSVLGLVVNLVGAVAFKTNNTWLGRMAKHTAPHTADPLAHRSNLQAAYLLVFADTASSVCVVVNSVLVRASGGAYAAAPTSVVVLTRGCPDVGALERLHAVRPYPGALCGWLDYVQVRV